MTKRRSDEVAPGADDSGELDLTSLRGRHFRAQAPSSDYDGEADADAPAAEVPVRAADRGDAGPAEADAADAEEAPEVEWPKLDELPRPHSHAHNKEVHRRHVRQRALRRLRVVLIVLLAVGVLAGGVAFGINRMIEEGARAMREASQPVDIQTVEEAQTQDEGLTVEYQGTTYRYNENVVSIVVMGYDRRQDVSVTGHAGQADAIMVVALDTSTGEMRVIGVPRDTMVDVDENVGDAFLGPGKMQIALAFSYGDGYDSSAQNVVRAVSRVLYNMPMNYYFALDMNGIGPINDAAGGVTVTPLSSIPNTAIVKDVPIKLYGTNAMRYVQYRDTSQLTSSLDRQARQSQYLKAFFSQAVGNAAGDPGILVGLYQTALDYSSTNLELGEFSYLAATLLEHGMSELDVVTLAGEPVKGEQYVEYHLDQDAVYETVLDVFYTPVEEGAPEPTAATE